jgi:hypothetical protein
MCHLRQQLTHSARCDVNQGCFSTLQRIGIVTQIVGSHALQHGGRGLLVADSVWYWHEPFGRHGNVFGIATRKCWSRLRGLLV